MAEDVKTTKVDVLFLSSRRPLKKSLWPGLRGNEKMCLTYSYIGIYILAHGESGNHIGCV
jgi:hypothetical protein